MNAVILVGSITAILTIGVIVWQVIHIRTCNVEHAVRMRRMKAAKCAVSLYPQFAPKPGRHSRAA